MKSIANRILDLLERSVLVQATVTVGLVATDIALWLSNRTPPDPLLQLTYAMVGVFLGGKLENAKLRATQHLGA